MDDTYWGMPEIRLSPLPIVGSDKPLECDQDLQADQRAIMSKYEAQEEVEEKE